MNKTKILKKQIAVFSNDNYKLAKAYCVGNAYLRCKHF